MAANAPIHILVNRKLGKLFVRRAARPVFQVPIAIDEPFRPIGTHVFMAQGSLTQGSVAQGSAAQAGLGRSWLAMTLPTPVREARMVDPRRPLRYAPTLPASPSDATETLARLHLAPGTAAYLASMITPGTTLILSDEGARNKEGQDYTNFIALTD